MDRLVAIADALRRAHGIERDILRWDKTEPWAVVTAYGDDRLGAEHLHQ